jgi:hypothetical protein
MLYSQLPYQKAGKNEQDAEKRRQHVEYLPAIHLAQNIQQRIIIEAAEGYYKGEKTCNPLLINI